MNIFRILAFAFTVVFLGACSSNDTASVILQKKNGIVVIYTQTNTNSQGLGTGYFIDENVIVTNAHVVNNAKQIMVGMEFSPDHYEAEVVNIDIPSDVAVIKLKKWSKFDSENPNWISLKFSNKVPEQGDSVWTIGHPWGLLYSISHGIISSTMRPDFTGSNTARWFVQTDAKIYNGNSGGPMLDDHGDIVGMNSLMVAQAGGSYGFAIPSSVIEKIISDLRKYNEVRWAKIGLKFKNLSNVLDGATTKDLTDSGIRAGDAIQLIINKRTNEVYFIANQVDYLHWLSSIDYSDKLTLVIVRGSGKSQTTIHVDVSPSYEVSKPA